MYLAMLNREKRHLFLNLEIYLSRIDGDFSDDEKRIIDVHCIEMHIDNNNYEADMPLDDVFQKLKETLTHSERRIVFLELAATIMADDVYHKEEEKITRKLSDLLEIDDYEVKEAFSIIKDMKDVYKRCSDYIE